MERFEGIATLMQGRGNMKTVQVVVLSDVLFFLQESPHKSTFFNPENKARISNFTVKSCFNTTAVLSRLAL